jgi:hypothetical protein
MIGSQEVHYNHDFDHVRLVYAQPFNYAVYGMSWNYAQILVHVDDPCGRLIGYLPNSPLPRWERGRGEGGAGVFGAGSPSP